MTEPTSLNGHVHSEKLYLSYNLYNLYHIFLREVCPLVKMYNNCNKPVLTLINNCTLIRRQLYKQTSCKVFTFSKHAVVAIFKQFTGNAD